MSDIALPEAAIDIIAGRYDAGLLGQNLHAAYWLHGRDDQAAMLLLHNAHKNLADIADAMGYTIARKDDAS